MKILKAGKPGFDLAKLDAIVNGAHYRPLPDAEPLPVAGAMLACGEQTLNVMAGCLGSRHLGSIVVHCAEVTRVQWAGFMEAIEAQTIEPLLTTFVFQDIQSSRVSLLDWLYTEFNTDSRK